MTTVTKHEMNPLALANDYSQIFQCDQEGMNFKFHCLDMVVNQEPHLLHRTPTLPLQPSIARGNRSENCLFGALSFFTFFFFILIPEKF